jgi:hypothetical protein
MSRLAIALSVAFAITFSGSSAVAAEDHAHGAPPKSATPAAAPSERCPHGVQRSLCARCNPKLAAVYKAKGDWCAEHARPESQCVLCHPELAKKGIK